MENYEIGLIFVDDKDYSNKAKWCNENGCYIEEIEPLENGTRQFQIKQIPQKTEDEKLIEQYQSEIVELKKYLSDTDYKAIKFAEGEITESDYQEVKLQRHNARVRINELESLIAELSSKQSSKWVQVSCYKQVEILCVPTWDVRLNCLARHLFK